MKIFNHFNNILLYSNNKDSKKKCKLLKRYYNFNVLHIRNNKEINYSELKKQGYMILDNLAFNEDYLEVIRLVKFNSNIKMIAIIDNDNIEQLKYCINKDFFKIYVKSFDLHKIVYDIDCDIKKNEILYIVDKENILDKQDVFFKEKFHFIKLIENDYKIIIDEVFGKNEIIDKLVKYNNKITKLNLKQNLLKELENYFKNTFLNNNLNCRRKKIEELSHKLVYEYYSYKPEDEIFKPIFDVLINKLNSKFYKLKDRNFRVLTFFEMLVRLEYLFIGNIIMNFVSYNIAKKTSSIIESTMHIYMSSSSDKLGNYTNNTYIKYLYCKKRNGVDNTNDFKEFEESFDQLNDFIHSKSNLFKSFKNENKFLITVNDLLFLINFVFKNGLKVKFPYVDVQINNYLDDEITFCLNEYILVNSIYSIIENSIENNCKKIYFYLNNNDKYIFIDIKDDGQKIPNSIIRYLFNKNFSYGKGSFHNGIGLYLSKNWLMSINCDIEYIEDKNKMQIKIPYRKEINESYCC